MNKQKQWAFRLVATMATVYLVIGPTADVRAQERTSINRVKQLLQAGKPTIGPIIQIPSAPVAVLLSQAGFDWLWLDCVFR